MSTAKALTPNPGYTPVAKEILQYPLAADKLISLVPTDYAQDYWFEKSVVAVLDDSGQASEEGAVQRIYRDKTKQLYTVDDRAFETVVPRRTEKAAQQQGFSDIQEAVVDLSMLTRTRHEKRAALHLQTAANYAANKLLTGTIDFTKWALPNTGDPSEVIYRLITALGPFDPALSKLTIALGVDAMNVVAQHDKVTEAIKYTMMGGRAGPKDLQMLFSKWYPVEEVLILQPVLQDATGNESKIWTADEVYVTITQRGTPDKSKPTFSSCFRQRIDGDDVVVYTDEVREGAHGGTAVKVAVSETFKLIDKQYGARLIDAV